jgi:signal transduction histidine kinase
MNWPAWRWLKRVPRLLAPPPPEPARQAQRSLTLQRHLVLPAKFVVIGVVFYYLFLYEWVGPVATTYAVVLKTMQNFFEAYIFLNLLVAVSFYVVRHWPAGFVQWVVFAIGLVDGLFLGGLTLMTGGFDSILFWIFPAVIVLNAICIPLAMPQIVLNLLLSAFYLSAGLLEEPLQTAAQTFPYSMPSARRRRPPPPQATDAQEARALITQLRQQADPVSRLLWNRLSETARERLASLADADTSAEELQAAVVEELNRLWTRYVSVPNPLPEVTENPAEPFLLRLVILWLLTACCYGVQVLAARQQLAEEEQKEFTARTEQLHAAGRLAAEFAHQIKNPLAIINNTVFSLQRRLREDQGESAPQIQIIQEEVEKADRIITQVMGYAQLSEGRVEKLYVVEELDRAIERVFPAGSQCGTELRRDYAAHFPPLLMQRAHLAEIFVNLLQNARDVLDGRGHITVTARCRGDYAVEVAVADDGPGIPADKLERVFEAYYTTRPKGTGLGLAIVKHNVELYGGSVRVESELGKGARFTVVFPATTAIKLAK